MYVLHYQKSRASYLFRPYSLYVLQLHVYDAVDGVWGLS